VYEIESAKLVLLEDSSPILTIVGNVQSPQRIDDFDDLEQDSIPTLPFAYIKRVRTILAEMKQRLAIDIYRGILLEVVQRVVVELQEKFVEDAASSDNLLIAIANFTYIRREFFQETTTENQLTEIDDTKTEAGLWSLL
jgi:hypothetical protein